MNINNINCDTSLETISSAPSAACGIASICEGLSALSSQPVTQVREGLRAIPIPARFDTLVVIGPCDHGEISRIRLARKNEIHAEGLNAFDAVRMVMGTPFVDITDWRATRLPTADEMHTIEAEACNSDALVLVIEANIVWTDAPTDTPKICEPLTLDDVAVLIP
ncbi:hypothetical protein [Altererythrobacter sp. MTPC7]|uniref:hypothetical protein n=1 Tax=Altererythrobacter sp. MTPC7 TaxID=3056567 RepID=UPI0036F320E1